MKSQFFYLVHVQYLGFRFHGWAKQPDLKTVHHMIDRTLRYVLGKDTPFKTLGSSRTDARVSAERTAFELFTESELELTPFLKNVNDNLPTDIRVLEIVAVDETFNIIQAPKEKSYQYLFTFGEKPHPFCAPLMAYFPGDLDIRLMQEGAAVFRGVHNFKKYCTKPSEHTVFEREVLHSEITINQQYQAN
ncbi:MAG: tRNA pseudouridine(38-40) synthase TruA, partial [Bacteroidota bacterium]